MFDYGTHTQRLQYALERGGSGIIHNDVYQLTLATRSHAAVDAWRRTLHSLYEHAGYGTLHTLTDASCSVLPPLAYATLFSDLWTVHQHRRLHSRNAVLCATALPPGAESVLHTLPGYGSNVVRFFGLADREQAVRWLMTDD